jgi:Tfp pilus assembly protein PilX
MAFRFPQTRVELRNALLEARMRGWTNGFRVAFNVAEARLQAAWAAINQLEMV